MRSIAFIAFLFAASLNASAQGGSGAPSPAGQEESARAASSAERAVEARHEKALAMSKARAARRAAKAASASSR